MPSILVGKYLLHTDVRLGSGGFGEVHAASLRGSVEVEDFAIKVGKRNNKKLVRRDQNELHILQSIKHPNIVELCDHFTADHGRLHLVMRRAAGDLTTMVTNFHSMRNFVNFSPKCFGGGTFRREDGGSHAAAAVGEAAAPCGPTTRTTTSATQKHLMNIGTRSTQPPPPPCPKNESSNQNEIHPNQFGAYEQWNCSLQICLGLEFLHNKNILHRDLKPENILFFRGAGSGVHGLRAIVWKLGDFGIGKEVDCAQAPQTHTVCGTHLYMAPEVLRGDRYFAAADMWSLGAVLYYVSFARVLFKTPAQVLLFQTAEHLEDWFPGRGCLVGDMGGRSKLKTVLAELALASTSASSGTSTAPVASNQNFSQKLIATAPAEVLEAYFSSTHASVRFWWSGAGNEVELECRPEARNAVLRNLPTIVAGCTRDLATCSRRLKHSGSTVGGSSGGNLAGLEEATDRAQDERPSKRTKNIKPRRVNNFLPRSNSGRGINANSKQASPGLLSEVAEEEDEVGFARASVRRAASPANSDLMSDASTSPEIANRQLLSTEPVQRDHSDVLPFFLFRFLCIQRKEADASHLLDYATSPNDLRLCLPVFAAAFGKQKTERLWAGLRSRFDWLSPWALKMADYGCRLEEVQENASGSNASGWSRRI